MDHNEEFLEHFNEDGSAKYSVESYFDAGEYIYTAVIQAIENHIGDLPLESDAVIMFYADSMATNDRTPYHLYSISKD